MFTSLLIQLNGRHWLRLKRVWKGLVRTPRLGQFYLAVRGFNKVPFDYFRPKD